MNLVGDAGLAMLVVGALVILVSAIRVAPVALRVLRTSRETERLARSLTASIEASQASLARSADERDQLLRPWRGARRVLLHPLTLALYESYRRRRRARAAL